MRKLPLGILFVFFLGLCGNLYSEQPVDPKSSFKEWRIPPYEGKVKYLCESRAEVRGGNGPQAIVTLVFYSKDEPSTVIEFYEKRKEEMEKIGFKEKKNESDAVYWTTGVDKGASSSFYIEDSKGYQECRSKQPPKDAKSILELSSFGTSGS